MVTDSEDEHVEPTKKSFNTRRFAAAVLIVAVPYALGALLKLPPPTGPLIILFAPLFAGLVAGQSGAQPVFQGASACALGTLLIFAAGPLAGYPPPPAGRDLVPTAFVVIYSTAVGGFGAWIASRGR